MKSIGFALIMYEDVEIDIKQDFDIMYLLNELNDDYVEYVHVLTLSRAVHITLSETNELYSLPIQWMLAIARETRSGKSWAIF